jgi:cell division septation protein DedD
VAAPPDACAACGAPAQHLQDYCLECGSRIAPARRFSAVGHAWERRFGRYPGDWIWSSVLLLLVAAGSATAGIVAGRDTGTRAASETVVATSPVVTAPPAPPAAKQQPTRTTAPASTPTPAPAPSKQSTEWPARDGYTVVLASIPAPGAGLKDARSKANAARAGGVRDVGILVSSRFASLHPGYYVVFAGVFDSLEEAQTAANRLSGRYPNAYARQITR